MNLPEMPTPPKTQDLLASCKIVFLGFVAGWAYQFSGNVLQSDMLGISFFRIFVVAGILAVIARVLWKHFKTVYEIFASVQFAATLGLALGVATILGTLVKQKIPPEEYIKTYGVTLTRILKNLFLDDVFYSQWFIFLLGFMVLGLIAVTIKRRQFTPDKWGFLFAHAGVVILLLGGWLGMTQGRKGNIELQEGQQKDSFLDQNLQSQFPMGFSLQLKKFSIDHYPTEYKLDVYTMSEKHTEVKKKVVFTLEELKKEPQKVLDSKYRVKLLRYYPHIGWAEKMIPVSDDKPIQKGGNILKKLSLDWQWKKEKGKGILFPNDPRRSYHVFPGQEILLFATEEKPPSDFAKEYPSGHLPAHHSLRLTKFAKDNTKKELEEAKAPHKNPGHENSKKPTGSVKSMDVTPGKEYDFEDYKIKVLQYVPDFSYDTETRQVVSRSQVPQNPALLLRVNRGNQEIATWLFANHTGMHNKKGLENLDLDIQYTYTPESKGFERYLLIFLNNDEIVEIQKGKVCGKAHLKDGYKINTDSLNLEISNLKISKVMQKFEMENLSDEDLNPGAEISLLEGDKILAKDWLVPREQSGLFSPDKKFFFQLRKDMEVKTYKSTLSIMENGKVVKEKIITVNDPLWYKGYAFYQASYKGVNISIIKVVLDQGLALVFLGMLLTSLGVPYIFYVQPILRAKIKKSLQEKISAEKEK